MKIKKLAYKTTLYIPTEDGDNQSLPKGTLDELMEESLKSLVKLGGGATIVDGMGYWKDEKNIVEKMETKLIICHVDDLEKSVDILKKLSLQIKKKTNSKAVCFEINDSLYIL
ncbi:hypothetical protein [Alkaliphilus hydrothermalis]|uniref:DUF190 domain-containing protein n=1 Tax=Alkaliphilus hydrothermalis TaxID=1482730 RepID=A0ABS2NQM2_9FIRM|nr:hypothetical protein [Alkaliphilus hydrothermalis]MBM7615260.1 hypothetical protein [Alkaliphilus hydrothermalis]